MNDMTASTTLCCAKRRVSRLRIAIVALLFCLGAAGALAAQTPGIEIRKAALTQTEEGYVLDAEMEIGLTTALDEALHKGVPLYFILEFELIRARWYWLNEKIASTQQQYRLSFNPLTRQYRVGVGQLYQNFPSLAEALQFLSRVRRKNDIEPGTLRKDNVYTAGVRVRLDTSQLPRPFQITALGSREWNIASDWYRWTVNP